MEKSYYIYIQEELDDIRIMSDRELNNYTQANPDHRVSLCLEEDLLYLEEEENYDGEDNWNEDEF